MALTTARSPDQHGEDAGWKGKTAQVPLRSPGVVLSGELDRKRPTAPAEDAFDPITHDFAND